VAVVSNATNPYASFNIYRGRRDEELRSHHAIVSRSIIISGIEDELRVAN
jgi:hypothetical protein